MICSLEPATKVNSIFNTNGLNRSLKTRPLLVTTCQTKNIFTLIALFNPRINDCFVIIMHISLYF